MIVRVTFYEIISLVIAALSIPTLFTVTGWLSPSTRKRRKLMQFSQILSNLPEGYERDRWKVIVDSQSKDARLAMRKRIDSDDVVAFIILALSVVIAIGLATSEDVTAAFQEANVIQRYLPIALFVGMNFLVVRKWIRISSEKRAEERYEEKLIERIAQPGADRQ
jgi:hypothetical protein